MGSSATRTWRASWPDAAYPVIIMHNRDAAADPAIDIVADVMSFFEHSLDIAAARYGIARERIVLDQASASAKTPQQSITCIARGSRRFESSACRS